jgi:hypothetical protein
MLIFLTIYAKLGITSTKGEKMTCISYIKNFFNWKAKINRKTFLIRFSILQLYFVLLGILGLLGCLNHLGLFVFILLILASIIGLLILYMTLCVLYQYIRMVNPQKTLITYFSWLVLFQLMMRCISFVIMEITTIFINIPNGLPGLGVIIILALILASLLPIVQILIAWLLTTKKALYLVQKIVDLLIVFWKKVSLFIHKK